MLNGSRGRWGRCDPIATGEGVGRSPERVHIRRALDRSGRSISKAAELLGSSRKTLWEKMTPLEIPNDPDR